MLHQIKAQLFVILLTVIVLVFFLIPDKVQQISVDKKPLVTESVLKALYEQNTDKPLEYAESKPIIKSMTKYLHQFDELIQSHPEQARTPLLIVERRLLYLKDKGLDVSKAKKILKTQVSKYIAKKS